MSVQPCSGAADGPKAAKQTPEAQGSDTPSNKALNNEHLIRHFVDLYCELCRVNCRIGIWDMRRHQVCKAPVEQIDIHYLVKTERLGRRSVERRAAIKTEIDQVFAELVGSGIA